MFYKLSKKALEASSGASYLPGMCSLHEIRDDKKKGSTTLATVEMSGSPPARVLANDVSMNGGKKEWK